MTATWFRRGTTALSLAVLLLGTAPAWAVNDVFDSSCAPPCLVPPKERLVVRGYGDFDANGATPTITGTLLKGKKKNVVIVNVTFQWFALGGGFRPFYARLNNKFPAPNFVIINWLDSCSSGMCARTIQYQWDLDEQELVYPGQFYGQPLVLTFDSNRTVDASSSYQIAFTMEMLKKK